MFTHLRSWALAHLCPSLLLTARLEFKSVCDGNESMIKMRIFQDSLIWAPQPFFHKYGIHSSQASCGAQNIGLNCFELFFFNKLGWLCGYLHCLAWEGKLVLMLIWIIGRSKKLYEGLIKQHSSVYYMRCIIHLQLYYSEITWCSQRPEGSSNINMWWVSEWS